MVETINNFITKKNRITKFLIIILSILVVSWVQWDRLTDPYRVEEDFRTFYWMNKFVEPELYPDDRLINRKAYFDIQLFGKDVPVSLHSPGYGFLFFAASFFMTPVRFSKFLPFLLTPISVVYAYKLGASLKGYWAGISLAIGFLLISMVSVGSQSVMLGVQRSFGPTLIIVLVYYLNQRRYLAASCILVISALIYAPAFLLGVSTWGIFELGRNWHSQAEFRFDRLRWLHLLAGALVGFVFIFPFSLLKLDDAGIISSNPSKEVNQIAEQEKNDLPIWENPKHRIGGYKPLYDHFPFVGRLGLVDKLSDGIHFGLLSILGGAIYVLLGRKSLKLPRVAWAVLVSGFLLYCVAIAAVVATSSFPLHMPSRYTRIGIFVFILTFIGLNLPEFADKAPKAIFKNHRVPMIIIGVEVLLLGTVIFLPADRASLNGMNMRLVLIPFGVILGILGFMYYRKSPSRQGPLNFERKNPLARAAIAGIATIILIAWANYVILIRDFEFLNPSETERGLLQYVETLPKDTLIAGTPCALDNIPLFAKRQILFSCEQSNGNPNLTLEALNVYYADREEEVINFCKSYGIDYLVIHSVVYSNEYINIGRIFYEPYNQQILPMVKERERYVLAEVPDSQKSFQNEDYFVVPCNAFK